MFIHRSEIHLSSNTTYLPSNGWLKNKK